MASHTHTIGDLDDKHHPMLGLSRQNDRSPLLALPLEVNVHLFSLQKSLHMLTCLPFLGQEHGL